MNHEPSSIHEASSSYQYSSSHQAIKLSSYSGLVGVGAQGRICGLPKGGLGNGGARPLIHFNQVDQKDMLDLIKEHSRNRGNLPTTTPRRTVEIECCSEAKAKETKSNKSKTNGRKSQIRTPQRLNTLQIAVYDEVFCCFH